MKEEQIREATEELSLRHIQFFDSLSTFRVLKYVISIYMEFKGEIQFGNTNLGVVRVSVQFSSVAQSCPTLCNPMVYIYSMEFSRPEYYSGKPFPSPGDFPTQESNPGLLHCRQFFTS